MMETLNCCETGVLSAVIIVIETRQARGVGERQELKRGREMPDVKCLYKWICAH